MMCTNLKNEILTLSKWIILRVILLTISFESIAYDSSTKIIEHTWQVYNYEVANTKLPESDEVSTIQNFNRATFKFYPNGKLIALLTNRGYFVGKWEKGKVNNSFSLKGDFLKKTLTIKIESINSDYTTFAILNKENKITNLSLMMMVTDESYKMDDVDFLENSKINAWRIRPINSENDFYLKKRCYDMLSYSIKLLQKLIEHQKGYSGTNLMQTPFQIYDGTITLFPNDDLPEKWITIFYDKEDAIKAQKIISDSFKLVKKYPSSDPANAVSNNKAYLLTLMETKDNLHFSSLQND